MGFPSIDIYANDASFLMVIITQNVPTWQPSYLGMALISLWSSHLALLHSVKSYHWAPRSSKCIKHNRSTLPKRQSPPHPPAPIFPSGNVTTEEHLQTSLGSEMANSGSSVLRLVLPWIILDSQGEGSTVVHINSYGTCSKVSAKDHTVSWGDYQRDW